MNDPHGNLQPYLDGELPSAAVQHFHEHLAACASCQGEMRELLLLDLAAARAMDWKLAHPAGPALQPAVRRAFSALRRRWQVPSLVGVAAVAVSLWMTFELRQLQLASWPTRSREWRLPSQGYQHYAPSRGAEGARPQEAIPDPPFLALAWLEWRGQKATIADAYLLRGQTQAAELWLDRAGLSADSLATRAALDLQLGRPEDAVGHSYDALRIQEHHPAALWNHALALRGLNLPLAAAQAFDAVASLEEPGWADEARAAASHLREESAHRRKSYEDGEARCRAAMQGERPFPLDLVASSHRQARVCFYDVLRSAGAAEAIDGLRPVAAELDVRSGGGSVLVRAVAAARASASGRSPLSRAYARAISAEAGADEWESLATAARAAGQPDIELGALRFVPAGRLDVERYRALAAATADPWFATLAEEKAAQVDRQRGQPLQALERLRPLEKRCLAEERIENRCLTVERSIAFSYAMLHRTLEAKDVGRRALALARAEGDLKVELNILEELGQVARLRRELGLSRAYVAEALELRPQSCRMAESARSELAIAHQRFLDFAEARRQVDLLQRCDQPPSLRRMFVLADLQRTRPGLDDEALLRRGAEAIRAGAGTEGDKALVTHILGRARLEHDRTAGELLLRQAISEAEQISGTDRAPEKARLYSYTSLILAAGQHGEYARALELFAVERHWAAPPSCSVWLTSDDERLLVIAVDPDGRVLGRYDGARTQPANAGQALVPPELLQAVRACAAVQVIARPPLEGLPGLLPPEIPWSQVVRHGAKLQPGQGPRVIVASPSLPASLGLPELSAPPSSLDAIRLEGSAATPSSVLQAARGASLLELHVHGVVDPDVADASHLVLSPEPSGRYELTARDVREEVLAAHPLVLLAACDSGDVRPDLQEGYGLPEAFVAAGARAVLAVNARINDPESELFFRPLLTRIQSGAEPAIALREARVAWHQAHGPGWTDQVLLFE